MKHISLIVCATLALGSVCWATAVAPDYYPNKVVPLPDVPYADRTNSDGGIIHFGQMTNDVIVVVENKLVLTNWKEWAIKYTIKPTGDDWYVDLRVDYCYLSDPTLDRPGFTRLTYDDQTGTYQKTALWDTLYASPNTPDQKLDWSVIGFPVNTPGAGSLALAAIPNPDQVIDTFPFTWNPEWVSLEFTGKNVDVTYEFIDWCVPEPATISLLVFGALAFLRRKH